MKKFLWLLMATIPFSGITTVATMGVILSLAPKIGDPAASFCGLGVVLLAYLHLHCIIVLAKKAEREKDGQ